MSGNPVLINAQAAAVAAPWVRRYAAAAQHAPTLLLTSAVPCCTASCRAPALRIDMLDAIIPIAKVGSQLAGSRTAAMARQGSPRFRSIGGWCASLLACAGCACHAAQPAWQGLLLAHSLAAGRGGAAVQAAGELPRHQPAWCVLCGCCPSSRARLLRACSAHALLCCWLLL